MEPAGRDPMLGRLVAGRYRVLARIARGGMATVFRALDTRLNREIALKVMHPHLAESHDFVERFRAEAQAAAAISHRHVVAVHDQGEDDELVWLAMELLPGRTLRDLLRERGGLSPAEAIEVMDALLTALDEAHAKGLIHRDVKPENVLVARDGAYKVNDFGLARAVQSSRTATGSLLGTPEYIAPETATSGQVDERVDVYSAGVLLFELLTGRQPHTGDVPFQVVWSHVTTDVPAPSTLAPYLPGSVDDVVSWACRRDPDERPGGPAELLDEIRRVWSRLDPEVLDSHPSARRSPDEPVADGATKVIDLTAARASAGATTATITRPGQRGRYDTLPDADPAHGAAGGSAGGRDGGAGDGAGDDEPDGTSDLDDPAAMLPPPRRRRWPAAVLLTLLLATVVALATVWYLEAGPGALRQVPDLRGLTAAAAEARLDEGGLASTTTTTFDEEAAAGTVVDTRPGAGQQVNKNGTVTLVVSQGPELFDVPDLRGSTQEEATRLLEDAGLTLGEVGRDYSPDVADGLVLSSDPGGGQGVRRGSAVAIVLSRGPRPVAVPDVTGGSTADARTALEAVGLRLGEEGEAFDDAPAGTVVAQDPADGELLPGGTVSVTVSKGPEPVVVPDVFERRFSDAKSELEGLGFVVERRGSSIFNRVVSQDPSAGTALPPGSTVVITTF